MRSDELLVRLRRAAFIGDASAYPEYTDAVLFEELNDRLRSVFSDAIISARSGYWLTTIVVTSFQGGTRLPGRSVVGGLESVEVQSNGLWFPLNEVTPLEAAAYTQPYTPRSYWCDNEKIVLVPTPPANVQLRLRYYLRPSLLVTSQSSALGGAAVDRGRITSVDPVTRIVAVNVVPFDYNIAVPAAITTGALVDVVRANGWFTPTVVTASTSITGLNITLTTSATLSDNEFADAVRIGDYVRVQEQTDWPALPQDFHRMLADAGAVNVLREMDLMDKAEVMSGVASSDYARFAKLIQPRVKSRPKKIRQKPYWARR